MEELMFDDFNVVIDEIAFLQREIDGLEDYAYVFNTPYPDQAVNELKSKLRKIKFNKYLNQCEDGS